MAKFAAADIFAGLVSAVKDAQRVLAERHLLHLTDYFHAVPPAKTAAGGDGSPAPAQLRPKLMRFLVPFRDNKGEQQEHELHMPLAAMVPMPDLQIKTVDIEFEARLDAPPDLTAAPPEAEASPLAAHLMNELDRLASKQQLAGRLQLEMKGSLFSSSMPLAKIKVTLEVREPNEALSRLTDHYLRNL